MKTIFFAFALIGILTAREKNVTNNTAVAA
jgi:hypothetical protein